jgi:HK97 family phage major capsid protein
LEKAKEQTKQIGDALEQPVGKGLAQPAGAGRIQTAKSLGDLFVDSKAYKGYQGGGQGPVGNVDVNMKDYFEASREAKTLFETTAGWAPETIRNRPVVMSAQRTPNVIDLIPLTQTSQVAITYMSEDTFTNNAAEVAEGGTYGEAVLELSENSSNVRKFAVWLPVTDEQLEDVERIRDYVNNRLRLMLDLRVDEQLITGDGSAPNIEGFLDAGRAGVQSQAKGDDSVPDAIYKGMTNVRVTGRAEPGAVIMHPNDWQAVRLLTTTDGVYIWGSPADAGPERIWGLPVVQATVETENTALVGDFAGYSEFSIYRGVQFQVTNAHSDYFVKGKQAIRADFRAAFVVYREAAFCKVTGI